MSEYILTELLSHDHSRSRVRGPTIGGCSPYRARQLREAGRPLTDHVGGLTGEVPPEKRFLINLSCE